MNEADYWDHLEHRVCAELAGIEDCKRRGLWCDGLVPETYELEAEQPCIRGTAWICPGKDREVWSFTLRLTQPHVNPLDLDWASLLPPEDVTRWIALDSSQRHIHFDPAAAVADALRPVGPAVHGSNGGGYAKRQMTSRPTERFTCPCCGHRTLGDSPGSFEICAVCFWEDDLVQLLDPAFAGGANTLSLLVCQANYAALGVSERRFLLAVRPAEAEEGLDPGWRPATDSDVAETWLPPDLDGAGDARCETAQYWLRGS